MKRRKRKSCFFRCFGGPEVTLDAEGEEDESTASSSSLSGSLLLPSSSSSGDSSGGESRKKGEVRQRKKLARVLCKIARSALFVKSLEKHCGNSSRAGTRNSVVCLHPSSACSSSSGIAPTQPASDKATPPISEPKPPPTPPQAEKPRGCGYFMSLAVLLLLGLATMLLWGRLCAILWTSTCLLLAPRRATYVVSQPVRAATLVVEKEVLAGAAEDGRQRVAMEGRRGSL